MAGGKPDRGKTAQGSWLSEILPAVQSEMADKREGPEMSEDLDLLRKLDGAGLLYAQAGGPPPRWIMDEAEKVFGYRAGLLSEWALLGQLSGHEFCYCSRCESVRLMTPTGLKSEDAKQYTTDPPAAQPYCKMTPGCVGHMVRIVKRPVMTKRLRESFDGR
jgi:hypothetical protein